MILHWINRNQKKEKNMKNFLFSILALLALTLAIESNAQAAWTSKEVRGIKMYEATFVSGTAVTSDWQDVQPHATVAAVALSDGTDDVSVTIIGAIDSANVPVPVSATVAGPVTATSPVGYSNTDIGFVTRAKVDVDFTAGSTDTIKVRLYELPFGRADRPLF
jgi:hypothetical protein